MSESRVGVRGPRRSRPRPPTGAGRRGRGAETARAGADAGRGLTGRWRRRRARDRNGASGGRRRGRREAPGRPGRESPRTAGARRNGRNGRDRQDRRERRAFRGSLAPRRRGRRDPRPSRRGELLPGALGGLRVGRRHLHRRAGHPNLGGPWEHLVLALRHPEGRPLLAARLHHVLAGGKAVGARAARLPPRQRAAAPRQCPARLAPAPAPRGARRLGRRRRVRGPSPARRVGGVGHRAQGSPLRAVLPERGARLDPLRRSAAPGTVRPRPRPRSLHRGPALEVDRGHPACRATRLALVAARPRHRERRASPRAAFPDRALHHGRRPRVLHLPGATRARLLARGTGAHRGARALVLHRQASLADRSRGDLPAVGHPGRRPPRVAVRRGRGGPRRAALGRPAPDRAGAARGGRVLCGDPLTGARVRGLRLHAVLLRGRPLPVPRRDRGDRGARRGRGPRGEPAAGRPPDRSDGRPRGRSRPARDADLAPGRDLPGPDHVLQPHRLAQPRSARCPLQPGQRPAPGGPRRGGPCREPRRGRAAPGLRRWAHQPRPARCCSWGDSTRRSGTSPAPWSSIPDS